MRGGATQINRAELVAPRWVNVASDLMSALCALLLGGPLMAIEGLICSCPCSMLSGACGVHDLGGLDQFDYVTIGILG